MGEDTREEGGVRTPRGTRVTPEDTTSVTWHAEATHREAMTQDLMRLGLWLTEHPGGGTQQPQAHKERQVAQARRVLQHGDGDGR
jgi:hypothetical protein